MKYTYTFDQLRDNDKGIEARFMSYQWMQSHGGIDQDNYFTADSGTVDATSPEVACEKLYRMYNIREERPAGYEGRSMSVSDIVCLWDNSVEPPVKTTWYCDSIGFKKLPPERSVKIWQE